MSKKTRTVKVQWLGEPLTSFEPSGLVKDLIDIPPMSGYEGSEKTLHRIVKRSAINSVLMKHGEEQRMISQGAYYPSAVNLFEIVQGIINDKAGPNDHVTYCLEAYR